MITLASFSNLTNVALASANNNADESENVLITGDAVNNGDTFEEDRSNNGECFLGLTLLGE